MPPAIENSKNKTIRRKAELLSAETLNSEHESVHNEDAGSEVLALITFINRLAI